MGWLCSVLVVDLVCIRPVAPVHVKMAQTLHYEHIKTNYANIGPLSSLELKRDRNRLRCMLIHAVVVAVVGKTLTMAKCLTHSAGRIDSI